MYYNLLLFIPWVACASSWYPYNVTVWGQEAEICERGTMQSPINLLTHPGFQQDELDVEVDLTSNLMASHSHSLQWTLQTDTYPAFNKNGVTYELLQWHCHTGSEHTVDGYQYPAECHFVHYSNDADQYAVIGVFLDDSASTPNEAFSKLLDDLPTTADWKEQKLNNFDWSDIISGVELEYYWSYIGSFTTPGCNENVQWTVLRDIVEVTAYQIDQIESTSGYDNNFRPPKPLHGRVVEDGSDIVNSNVTWVVTTCCFEMGIALEIKSSLALVLGLSSEDIQVTSFFQDGDRSWIINYSIYVIKNTITFVRNLLENLEDEVFMAIIKAQIEADFNLVEVSTFVSLSVYSGSSWHYPYNETEWGEEAEICKTGKMQSPVNLPPHPGINQNEINTTLGLTSNLEATHKHSLQWDLITENYPTLYVKGLKYKLVQWHCHTGSEHFVDGYQYPGECHFVHYFKRDNGSEYAVLGVFLNDNATSENPAFSALLDDLPATNNWEDQDLINFEWSSIISGVNLEYYWSYTGSFTTPNCAENVQWTVLRDVVDVTPSQIEQIMNTSGFDNNFRPPMALHGRVIEDGSKMVKFTVIWTVNACCLKSATVFEITSSVGLVLGVSTEDILLHSFYKHDGNSWTIEYEITVSRNTHTFLTFLLRNLEDDEVLGNIKSQIENDIKTVEVSTFESVSFSVDTTYISSSWHYPYEVTEWGEVAEICEYGTVQSPIDLPAHPGIKQSKINTTLNMASNLTASHVHSLQWNLVAEKYPNLNINGMNYKLVQWHCHTGSEHTVNRYQYPGECHFVHQFPPPPELGSQYAVIGFFLNDGATSPNAAFSDLLDHLPATDEWETQYLNINFDWSRLISSVNLEYYWSYIGSFTTPGCNEGVQWTVLRDIVEVTPDQIRQMEETSGFDNNFRPPTLLHGRVVKDGSNLVTSSVRWTVTVCCIGMEDLQEMTNSVGTAIGLSADDIHMVSFTGHSESTYEIKWEITIIENTQTFLTYLVQNLNNEEYIETVKNYTEQKTKTVTLSRFESLAVDAPTSASGRNEAIEAIIICLLTILFVCLVTIAVNLKKYYLQSEVAHRELNDQKLLEMS